MLTGLVTACRLATMPTYRSPFLGLTATTDGVVRPPSVFSRTSGSPASMTAIAELVVPRSMPITFAISGHSFACWSFVAASPSIAPCETTTCAARRTRSLPR